jgi:hypothetical protein
MGFSTFYTHVMPPASRDFNPSTQNNCGDVKLVEKEYL